MRKSAIFVILLSLIILSAFFVFAATRTGRFTVGNEPPTAANLQVRDSATHWDDYLSDNIMDTHDITSEFRWDLSDPNPDTITTKVCISSSSLRDCDLVNTVTAGSQFTYSVAPGVLSYPDCGSTKTYYIDLTPNDGQIDGAKYSAEFTILNSVPVSYNLLVNGVPTATTHDQTPTLSWTYFDADDGSQDHWPADTLTNSIIVGDTCGTSEYLNSNPANPTAETTSTIPWGPIIGTQSVKDFCARTMITDGVCPTQEDKTLQLIDNIPNPATAQNIFLSSLAITSSDSCIDFLPQHCSLIPLAGTYTSVNLQLNIADPDRDCSALTHSAQITLETPLKNYVYDLTFSSMTDDICTFTASIPIDDARGIEFFRNPGVYNMKVTATSQAGALAPATYQWEYVGLIDINYQDVIEIGDPSSCGGNDIQLGQWNPGICTATMTNFGNTNLNLNWEATDPRNTDTGYICPATSPDCCSSNTAECWDLTSSSDLQVDDDSISQEATETSLVPINIPEEVVPTSALRFDPNPLQVCDSMLCNNPLLSETLDTYFHIRPPLGLTAGTYETTITVTLTAV